MIFLFIAPQRKVKTHTHTHTLTSTHRLSESDLRRGWRLKKDGGQLMVNRPRVVRQQNVIVRRLRNLRQTEQAGSTSRMAAPASLLRDG